MRKVTCLLLASIMAFALIGCGNSSQNTDTTSTNTVSTVSDSNANAEQDQTGSVSAGVEKQTKQKSSNSAEDKLKALEGSALPDAMNTIKKLGYKATYYADGEDFTDFIDSVKADYAVGKLHINSSSKKVKVDIVTKSSIKSKSVEEKLAKKLKVNSAWEAAEEYGKDKYGDSFKLKYLTGNLGESADDGSTWSLKAECKVNGKKKTCEAKVTGTTDVPEVTSFDVY